MGLYAMWGNVADNIGALLEETTWPFWRFDYQYSVREQFCPSRFIEEVSGCEDFSDVYVEDWLGQDDNEIFFQMMKLSRW